MIYVFSFVSCDFDKNSKCCEGLKFYLEYEQVEQKKILKLF
jgi:hypothetical protein